MIANQPPVRVMVTVDDVDLSSRAVHCIDANGGKFRVSYFSTDSSFQIPKPQERWVLMRLNRQWYLDSRVEGDDDPVALSDLQAGDTRIASSGTTHISSPSGVMLNKEPFGIMTFDRVDLGNDSTDTFILSQTPVNHRSVQIFNNEFFWDPNNVTIEGRTITFARPVDGVIVVYYQYTPGG